MAYSLETRCIHGDEHRCPDKNNAISYPIYQTASFSHLTPGHNPNGFDYSRESNPTRAFLEETVASLSGLGYGALKEAVSEAVIAELTPIQERYNAIIADKDGMNAMLKRNAERAAYLSQKTLRKVYKKVGLYQF